MSAGCRNKLEPVGLGTLRHGPDYNRPWVTVMTSHDPAGALHVDLQHMPHETYIRRSGEDWAGVTDQKARKKLQNRLNQRAARQRKRQHGGGDQSPSSSAVSPVSPASSGSPISIQHYTVTVCHMDNLDFKDVTEENVKQKRAILQRFAEQALKSHAKSDPRADHRLRLIQLNIINSLTRNSAILGFKTDWLVCASVSPFAYNGQNAPLAPCPDNLVPTRLQREIRHHPWVDLFPLPRMRDNFLLAITRTLSAEEEEQLWNDVVESSEEDWAGFIVWGESWDPRNWEVTMLFLQRWGWLLRGCPEILEATNYWRRQRGERPIKFDTFSHLQDHESNPSWSFRENEVNITTERVSSVE